MAKPTGQIELDIEEMLLNIAKEREQKAMEDGGKALAELQEQKEKFYAVNATNGRLRRLSYQTLPYMLDYAGIGMKEMYHRLGIEIDWTTQAAADFYESVKKLDVETQETLMKVIVSISHPFWYSPSHQEDKKMMATPTKRAIAVLLHKYDASANSQYKVAKSMGPDFRKAWEDKKFFTTVKTTTLPQVAKRLEISLHWLLGNQKHFTTLADTPLEEQIMSGYQFLAKEEAQIAEDFVALNLKKENA